MPMRATQMLKVSKVRKLLKREEGTENSVVTRMDENCRALQNLRLLNALGTYVVLVLLNVDGI